MSYRPPFKITNTILLHLQAVSKALGFLAANTIFKYSFTKVNVLPEPADDLYTFNEGEPIEFCII